MSGRHSERTRRVISQLKMRNVSSRTSTIFICSNDLRPSALSGGLTSTAITVSAPNSRQAKTGTGSTSPPSIKIRPSRSTGRNTPGTDMEARTAERRSPSRITTRSPECKSVAMAAKGMVSSPNARAGISSPNRSPMRSPRIRALLVRCGSKKMRGNFFQSGSAHQRIARPIAFEATTAPIIAPMDVPATQ